LAWLCLPVPDWFWRWSSKISGRPRNRLPLIEATGVGINFTDIMGDYKGRVKLRQRKKRFAKDQRIKALAATKKGTTPPQGAAEQ
jgi:hypothetical protein